MMDKSYSLNYMNPFRHDNAPADGGFGKYVALNSTSRFEIHTSTTKDRVILGALQFRVLISFSWLRMMVRY
jgi:hypothetical protein